MFFVFLVYLLIRRLINAVESCEGVSVEITLFLEVIHQIFVRKKRYFIFRVILLEFVCDFSQCLLIEYA